jgi:type IV pilus assembly protein PilB
LGRLFNRDKPSIDIQKNATNGSQKISLRNAGIFNNDISAPLPSQVKKPIAALDNISKEVPRAKPAFVPSAKPTIETFRQQPASIIASKEKNNPPREVEITPFPTKTSVSQVEYVDLSKTIIPKTILHKIPEKVARQYKIAPVSETDQDITIAMVDPQDLEAREMIKKMVGKTLIVKLSSEDDINHILDQYSGLETELSEAIKTANEEKTEQEKIPLIESASDNAPAARIVTSLLRRAIRDKASDIHIEPEEKDVLVRFRQDGILRKTVALPKDLRSSVVSRIKIMANMKIDEQRLPQDGRFSITVDNRKVDFRVSTMPVANGEKVVMRVLDKLTGILTIEQLGIRGGGLKSLQNNLKKSHGMILVTGPTGSGKTTTLYALIDNLYTEGVNIVTLEDPIEYRMPGINQSQVNAGIDYTFASGLRSIVRQDPDIIMIGEIRDAETAEMAVHAALTGHIVLSTLHTNDSAGAAPRLLDMGVEPFLLTSSLNIVIAQRLARKICEDCKEELPISSIELEKIKVEINKMPEAERPKMEQIKFFHGKGCNNCNNSGYKGRIGLYEALEITEPLKELILKKESSFKLQEEAVRNGMVTMLGDGIIKALSGLTTLEEVWRITEE